MRYSLKFAPIFYEDKKTQVTVEASHQKILILFAHPAIHKSRVNRELIKPLQNIEGITFHDLYETYPNFYIDIKKEQKLLMQHDVIVMMHPFYWYSLPSILKEWLDLVLEHGFAYGNDGSALNTKKLISVITTAGSHHSYQSTGSNRYTILQLLAPLMQTAFLCQLEYLPPFVIHDTLHLTSEDIAKHTQDLEKILLALRDDNIDFAKVKSSSYLNTDLSAILKLSS